MRRIFFRYTAIVCCLCTTHVIVLIWLVSANCINGIDIFEEMDIWRKKKFLFVFITTSWYSRMVSYIDANAIKHRKWMKCKPQTFLLLLLNVQKNDSNFSERGTSILTWIFTHVIYNLPLHTYMWIRQRIIWIGEVYKIKMQTFFLDNSI